jgi:hypothetical protein
MLFCLNLAVKINIENTAFLYWIVHRLISNNLLRLANLLHLFLLGRFDEFQLVWIYFLYLTLIHLA